MQLREAQEVMHTHHDRVDKVVLRNTASNSMLLNVAGDHQWSDWMGAQLLKGY